VGKKERKKRLQGSLSLPSKKGMLANSLLLWGKKKKKDVFSHSICTKMALMACGLLDN